MKAKNRVLSFLLALVMVFSLLPTGASALAEEAPAFTLQPESGSCPRRRDVFRTLGAEPDAG